MVGIQIILEFEVVFPEEQPLSLDEYFTRVSKERLLKLGSYLLGFKNQNSRYRDPRFVLSTFFGPENTLLANEVYTKVLALKNKTGQVPLIVHPYSSLILFEYLINKVEDIDENIEQSSEEFEANFFRAYLSINSEFVRRQAFLNTTIEDLDEKLKIPMMIFGMSYAYSDKSNYDLRQQWVTQIIKSVLLFQFLEKNEKTKKLFSVFLNKFNCSTWQQYMIKYIPLTISVLNKERETYVDYIIKEDEFFDNHCDFLENFIRYNGPLSEELDFLSLRSKPLYKVKRGHYRTIYDLFIVEKIYKGLYFVLRDINETLSKLDSVKELKSFYGKHFAEGVLTYTAVDQIYPKGIIKLSGDEMDKIMDGAPDYYVRWGKDIVVFESKDFLIPAEIKLSFDFNRYEEAFEERLYFTEIKGKQTNKAVMQLINTVKKLLKNKFKPDTEYKYREVNIYPIIIVHDHQYDAAGLEILINYWFQEELQLIKEDGYNINKVKRLVIVNVDQLLYHHVPLLKNISLHRLLDIYFEHIRELPKSRFRTDVEWQAHLLRRTTPFSVFLSNYIVSHKLLVVPPMLHELGLPLFGEDNT